MTKELRQIPNARRYFARSDGTILTLTHEQFFSEISGSPAG